MTRIASVSGLRGIVGDGIDPASAAEFVAAYAAGQRPGPIAVGNDGRPSAPVFVPAVLAAIAATGRDALDLGPVATPTLGRYVAVNGLAGGVMVSASHNPPEYNGLKFFQPGGFVLDADAGRAMLGRFEAREHAWVAYDKLGRARAVADPFAEHIARILSLVDVDRIRAKKFRVLLDGCHGGGARAGGALLRALGAEAIVIGGEPDGLYDHVPEPTEANLKVTAALVPASGAAVGFVQDPDADRLALIDEGGRYIGEELTLALAALRRLDQETGPVVLNLSTSRVTEDLAKARGCPVFRTPVGEAHVVARMRSEGAVLGGEGNGGVIDPRVGFVRDSLAGIALTLDLLAADAGGRPLSAIADALPKYEMVKRKFDWPAGAAGLAGLWDRIVEASPGATVDRRDGLHLSWDRGWVQLRASNTEPIVRVIAEAADRKTADAMADELGRWLGAGT